MIKWITGLIKSEKKRKKAKVEIEELKKALMEDPEFRDEILRELEYRTGRRDLLKVGVLGLLGLTVGSVVGSEGANAQSVNTTKPLNLNVVRDTVSDYAVKVPKPCTCIVAQDGTGDYDVSPREDASGVIQKAIDYAHKKGGGEVRITNGEYTVSNVKINTEDLLLINAYGAIFKNRLNRPSFIFNSKPTGIMQAIIGAVFRKSGILIKDTYHITVEDCRFISCNVGISLVNENYWTESTNILNCYFSWCGKAIEFLTLNNNRVSFSQTKIHSVDIEGCNIGVDINKNCAVNRSSLLDITIWLSGDKIGWRLNGKLNKTIIFTSFDGKHGGVGFDIGENFSCYNLPLILCSPGNISTLVNNPYKKKFRIITPDGGIYLFPSKDFRDVLNIYSESSEVASLKLNNSDGLSIGSRNPIVFWDIENQKRAEVRVGNIDAEGDLILQSPTCGVIFKDAITKVKYKLSVRNGKLHLEKLVH